MTDPYGSLRLKGVDAKLGRAREHLDTLKAELGAMYNDPDTVRLDKRSDWEYTLVADFPDLFHAATVAGDAVQNLRSALDHLVWALVVKAGTHPPDRHTRFPTCSTRQDFVEQALRGGRRSKPFLLGLKPRSYAVRRIVAAQPYRSTDPEHHWIGLLNRLANLDKHKTVYNPVHLLDGRQLSEILKWNPEAIVTSHVFIANNAEVVGTTELMRITFDPSGPPGEVNMEGRFPVTPTFGVSMNIEYRGLDWWHRCTTRYIDGFRYMFD